MNSVAGTQYQAWWYRHEQKDENADKNKMMRTRVVARGPELRLAPTILVAKIHVRHVRQRFITIRVA